MQRLGYRPEIDGLRAVAVTAVILFHAGFGCTGGYIGVDVFFVISGYLITRLIRRDIAAERFSVFEFWERRIRRIVPALFSVVTFVLVVGLIWLLPGDMEELAESTLAVSLMASNFYFWLGLDYFAGPAELKPLLHTWSLAVEEQFYLGFPILLILCSRFRLSVQAGLLATFAAASFLLSVWGSYTFSSATFFLLPTRIWELLTGALLVFIPPPSATRKRSSEVLGAAGLVGVIVAAFWFDSETKVPGIPGLLPCISAALVIYANSTGATYSGRMLSSKPMVFVGRLSYSFYLWHWPVLAFLRYRIGEDLSIGVSALAISFSFVGAYLSWRFVETPFRRRTGETARRRVFGSAILASVALLGTSIWIVQSKGFSGRLSQAQLTFVEGEQTPALVNNPQIETFDGRLQMLKMGSPDQRPCFLLWGDSHAGALYRMFDRLAEKYKVAGCLAQNNGTPPALGTWRPKGGKQVVPWREDVLDFVRQREITNVILVARWTYYIEGDTDGNMESLIVDETSPEANPVDALRALRTGLLATLNELEQAGVRVWIMKQVPLHPSHPRLLVNQSGGTSQGISLQAHRARNTKVQTIFSEVKPDVTFLDPSTVCFDESGHSIIEGHGYSYYIDDDHLSPTGADRLLRGMFEDVFAGFAQTCEAL